MAERSQINKYYPPDWEPSKGNLDKFHGSDPLGRRGRFRKMGILTVRIEMPFNAWCTHCDHHIGKGVRFNAEKCPAGMYHSTKIWDFAMECPHCFGPIVMRTDPENCDYKFMVGGRKKMEEWTAESAESIALQTDEEKLRRATDPLFRLEKGVEDQENGEKFRSVYDQLVERDKRVVSDETLNKKLRRANREERRILADQVAEGARLGIHTRLLPLTEGDVAEAANARSERVFRKDGNVMQKGIFEKDMMDVAGDLKHMNAAQKHALVVKQRLLRNPKVFPKQGAARKPSITIGGLFPSKK